jgi:hypothetical protein
MDDCRFNMQLKVALGNSCVGFELTLGGSIHGMDTAWIRHGYGMDTAWTRYGYGMAIVLGEIVEGVAFRQE